jgi:hypothetical protein
MISGLLFFPFGKEDSCLLLWKMGGGGSAVCAYLKIKMQSYNLKVRPLFVPVE